MNIDIRRKDGVSRPVNLPQSNARYRNRQENEVWQRAADDVIEELINEEMQCRRYQVGPVASLRTAEGINACYCGCAH